MGNWQHLYIERPNLEALAVANHMKRRPVLQSCFDYLLSSKAHREFRPIERNFELFEKVRHPTQVVFVTMGDDHTSKILSLIHI